MNDERYLWVLVGLLEKAKYARLAGMPHLFEYVLITMKRLLCRRFQIKFHTLN